MDEQVPSSDAGAGLLSSIAAIGIRRPWITLGIAAVILTICAAIAWDMPISTSRYKLMSADHPYQARMINFFDRFGFPDSMVVLITGAEAEDRRKVVDRFSELLEQEPELEGRVLGRVGLDQVAELALLMQPDAISQLRDRLGEQAVTELIEGGLPAWIRTVNAEMSKGLDDEDEEDPTKGPDAGNPPDAKQARKAMLALAKVLRAIDAQLAGDNPMRELPRLDGGKDAPKELNIDAKGYVIGEQGKYHVIALFPELPGAEGFQVKPLVTKVRRLRDQVVKGTGVDARVTGLPALVADELAVVSRGIKQTSVATTLGILLLLYVAFRSFRYTILALLPLGLGVVLTLAVVRQLYGGLNLITSSFISVLLALGIDFGVYVLSRYGEQVRAGSSPQQAIRGALAKAGPGMIIGAVTTIMAFMMTTTTEFTAYSQLGVITSLGLALMLGITLVALPALIWLAGRGREIRSPELPGLGRLPAKMRKGSTFIVAVAAVLVALSAMTWSRIKFNPRYFDFLPKETESAWGLRHIEKDKSLSPVQAGVGAESVEEARQLAARLRKLPAVGAVQTATDALPKLDAERLAKLRASFSGKPVPSFAKLRTRKRSNKELSEAVLELVDTLDEVALAMRQADMKLDALNEVKKAAKQLHDRAKALPDNKALEQAEQRLANILERAWLTAQRVATRGKYLPTDLPAVFKARFMSKDGKALAVYANPAGDIWHEPTAKKFASDLSAVAPNMAGIAMNIYEHIRMIKEGFTRASILSASLVLLVLLAGFRKLFDALLALVPVAIGVAWMLGAMGALGLHFDVANVVVVPLILGIGIDAGAHMVHRWRQSADENGGVAKLDELIRGTGAAVLLASLTTATGFSALMIGDYGAMKSLGLSMTIGIGACLLSSMLVLPALLLLLKKAR